MRGLAMSREAYGVKGLHRTRGQKQIYWWGLLLDQEAVSDNSLESVFDDFVMEFGGARVSGMISQNNPGMNADYFFAEDRVIAELKCLQTESFGPQYKNKMKALTDSWVKKRQLVVFGTVNLSLRDLPPTCREEWLRVIEGPLENNIIGKANKQIKSTKSLLNAPDAMGLLLLASDGNHSLQPNEVLFFLLRILQKKKPNGEILFSGIRGVCYFSLNMRAHVVGLPAPVVFWIGGPREQDDVEMRTFCDRLELAWHKFQCRLVGIDIPRVVSAPGVLAGARFAAMPKAGSFYKDRGNRSFRCLGVAGDIVRWLLMEVQVGEHIAEVDFRQMAEHYADYIPIQDRAEIARLEGRYQFVKSQNPSLP